MAHDVRVLRLWVERGAFEFDQHGLVLLCALRQELPKTLGLLLLGSLTMDARPVEDNGLTLHTRIIDDGLIAPREMKGPLVQADTEVACLSFHANHPLSGVDGGLNTRSLQVHSVALVRSVRDFACENPPS